jgi:hypothetical protein
METVEWKLAEELEVLRGTTPPKIPFRTRNPLDQGSNPGLFYGKPTTASVTASVNGWLSAWLQLTVCYIKHIQFSLKGQHV